MWSRPFPTWFLAAVLLAGCGSGDDGSVRSVAGRWAGNAGEGIYLELTQARTTVSGQACERPGHDCYPVRDGNFADPVLRYYYEWPEGGTTYRVTAEMTLSADGQTMTGTLQSTKCNCDHAATVERLP